MSAVLGLSELYFGEGFVVLCPLGYSQQFAPLNGESKDSSPKVWVCEHSGCTSRAAEEMLSGFSSD